MPTSDADSDLRTAVNKDISRGIRDIAVEAQVAGPAYEESPRGQHVEHGRRIVTAVGPGGQGGEYDQDDGRDKQGTGPRPPIGQHAEEELADDLDGGTPRHERESPIRGTRVGNAAVFTVPYNGEGSKPTVPAKAMSATYFWAVEFLNTSPYW